MKNTNPARILLAFQSTLMKSYLYWTLEKKKKTDVVWTSDIYRWDEGKGNKKTLAKTYFDMRDQTTAFSMIAFDKNTLPALPSFA